MTNTSRLIDAGTGPPANQDSSRISSLLQNPASGNIPTRLSAPITVRTYVPGIALRRPPMYIMLKVPAAWFTLPAPRNSSALKKAWVNRWNSAALYAPTPSAAIM